jgi:predicted ATP-dependent Lon-type protease
MNNSLIDLDRFLKVVRDNGAKRALIPIESKRSLRDVSANIMEHTSPRSSSATRRPRQ